MTFVPDRELFPFESRWFTSDVGQVHYIDEGSGPPILMLHGNPTWSFLYRGIIIRLREHFRCIAVDYPGFGLSPHPPTYRYTAAEHAEVVSQLVRELGLSDLTIMGQDWGGPIGMRVALDDPDRLRALVMGNTWYWPAITLPMQLFSKIMSSGFIQGQIFKKNMFVERMIPLGVKHKLAPEVMDHYRGPLSSMDSRAGVAEFPKEIINAERWLREIAANVAFELGRLPLLLVWGMNDMAFTPGFMKRFREDFESVSIVRLEAKHYIQEDAPVEIAAAIKAFLGT
ncbi:MAG: haloalkane dehalogenase [Gemmatimonadota bacterium]|nr:MAG: haloalkane dehalogenase [Gemmatimonadota bacterium]